MSDDITTTDETEASTDEGVAGAAEKLVEGLFGIGRLWAAHGLNVGRSALETTATTLRTTADLLGDVSRRFSPEDETSR